MASTDNRPWKGQPRTVAVVGTPKEVGEALGPPLAGRLGTRGTVVTPAGAGYVARPYFKKYDKLPAVTAGDVGRGAWPAAGCIKGYAAWVALSPSGREILHVGCQSLPLSLARRLVEASDAVLSLPPAERAPRHLGTRGLVSSYGTVRWHSPTNSWHLTRWDLANAKRLLARHATFTAIAKRP